MGAGKTTVSLALQKKLNDCVFLDGDWCWYTNPWILNTETRKMVIENICFILNNYLKSTSYQNIIFCWIMHEDKIVEDILSRINTTNVNVHNISLIASSNVLVNRLQKDIDEGKRPPIVIPRALERLKHFENVNSHVIDTSNLDVNMVTKHIFEFVRRG